MKHLFHHLTKINQSQLKTADLANAGEEGTERPVQVQGKGASSLRGARAQARPPTHPLFRCPTSPEPGGPGSEGRESRRRESTTPPGFRCPRPPGAGSARPGCAEGQPRAARGYWGRPPHPRPDSAPQVPTEGGSTPRGPCRAPGPLPLALRPLGPQPPHSPRPVASAPPPAGSRGLPAPQDTSGFANPVRGPRDRGPARACARAHALGSGLSLGSGSGGGFACRL